MSNYPQLPENDDRDDGKINHALLPHLSRRGQSEITKYPVFGPFPVPEPETDDVQALLQLLRVLWRHKWLLALSLVTGILAASALTLYMTPVYRATSILEIQSVREVFASVGQASNDASTVSVITEAQVLASKALRERVLSKLNSAASPPVPRGSEPLSFWRNLLRLHDPAESVTWHEAVAMAGATLDIQPGHDSRIITIQCDSNSPQAAADFANVLTEEYLQRNQEERWEAYQKTSKWLNRAQQELKAKLEKSEQDLSDFAISEGLILTSDTQNLSEGKLKELQSELGRATANRIEKQSLVDSNVSGRDKSLPEVLASGPMETLQTRLADLRRQLVELTVTLTPEHYKVKQLQAQIEELEAAKETERSNIIKRMGIQYEAAQKRENALQKSFDAEARVFSTQTQRLIYYNILKREVETNKTLYQTTLEKGKEASLAAAMSSNNAHIVDPALVPRNPLKPSLPFNLALGSIGGLILGAGFVVVRTRSNASIQGPGIFGAQIRVQELGVIPSAKTDPEVRALTRRARSVLRGTVAKTRNKPGSMLKPEIGNPKVTDCLEMVTWTRKRSMVAEAVRATMTSILMSRRNGVCPKVLLLTSPSPQEGKSTIVSNLGIALAEIGQRVLLIDGDMRLPRLHTIFDVPNTFGMSDILNEPKPLSGQWNDALTRKTSIPGLHVIPAGPVRTNLSRLLHSPRMREFTDRLRETYDFVLIDTAPVLTVPDARILAFSADAVVLVVRAHKTASASALAAVARFEDDGTSILGTILNDWNPKLAHYGHHGSDGADTSYYYKSRRQD
jgi:polysaccharide biosynthesis transport protein